MDLGDLISAVGMWTSKTPAIGLPACSRRLYGVRLGYTPPRHFSGVRKFP